MFVSFFFLEKKKITPLKYRTERRPLERPVGGERGALKKEIERERGSERGNPSAGVTLRSAETQLQFLGGTLGGDAATLLSLPASCHPHSASPLAWRLLFLSSSYYFFFFFLLIFFIVSLSSLFSLIYLVFFSNSLISPPLLVPIFRVAGCRAYSLALYIAVSVCRSPVSVRRLSVCLCLSVRRGSVG